MPRLFTSANDPLDFCQRCFPRTEVKAFNKFGNLGDGPDGRGNCFSYDADHPTYDDTEYQCVRCRKALTSADDTQT